jgi:hypothetical protein
MTTPLNPKTLIHPHPKIAGMSAILLPFDELDGTVK